MAYVQRAGLIFSLFFLWGFASTPNTAPNNAIHLNTNSQGQTGITGFQSHQRGLKSEGQILIMLDFDIIGKFTYEFM